MEDDVEQILIRNLPPGTKAALRARAQAHSRSAEAEARSILAGALDHDAASIVELLSDDDGAQIEFDPRRLHLGTRSPEL